MLSDVKTPARPRPPQPAEYIRKIPPPNFADNFAPTAHNQPMSAHPANSFSCCGHRAKNPRRIVPSAWQFRPSSSPKTALSTVQLTQFVKKPALRLVQSALNPFIINRNLQKSRRKNEKKRPKIALFRPFSAFFGEFLGVQKSPDYPPDPSRNAASTPSRYEGMHTVWTRYGKGMRPSLNSFAIKYGGMPYRGGGGWP